SLDLAKVRNLEFYEPDFRRFPCLTLAREAARKGGFWPTVLNAADETAVHAFLDEKIRFTDIAKIIEKTFAKFKPSGSLTLETVFETDQWARQTAKEFV